MSNEEIIESNKLIAEFIGKKRKYESTESIFLENLKYYTSWDWLMPVVEKINKMALDNIGEVGFVIYPERCDLINSADEVVIEGFTQKTTLEAVWLAVVEFIKWYHNQK